MFAASAGLVANGLRVTHAGSCWQVELDVAQTRCSKSNPRLDTNRTVVTLPTHKGKVSFMPGDLALAPGIWIADFGVWITRADSAITAQAYANQLAIEGKRTIRARAAGMPEQSWRLKSNGAGAARTRPREPRASVSSARILSSPSGLAGLWA